MKNPELFHKTISILVKAYQNDTLRHGDWCECAVGNLVSANGYEKPSDWFGLVRPSYFAKYNEEVALEQIESTQYSVLEVIKIEDAFESVNVGYDCISEWNSDQHQLDGLLAVVDALMIIHEATKEEAEEAKLLFVK